MQWFHLVAGLLVMAPAEASPSDAPAAAPQEQAAPIQVADEAINQQKTNEQKPAAQKTAPERKPSQKAEQKSGDVKQKPSQKKPAQKKSLIPPEIERKLSIFKKDQRLVFFRMLQRNNELRGSVGLGNHKINQRLCQAAQDHAEYMAQTGDFDHWGNDGPQGRANRYEYGGSVRENIAMGYTEVSYAFQGWRGSSSHWTSIISDTSEAGFGYAVSDSGTPYWVGVYGYPAPDQEVGSAATDENQTAPSYNSRRRRLSFRRWR
jgi:uncharacterized protein YkwD